MMTHERGRMCLICAEHTCKLIIAEAVKEAIAARDAERDKHDQNWMSRHDDAQAYVPNAVTAAHMPHVRGLAPTFDVRQ